MLSTEKKIELFRELFKGREDAFGTYSQESGDAFQIKEAVTNKVIEAHLLGDSPLGIYPLIDGDMCWWGCIDVDSHDFNLVKGIVEKSKLQYELPCYIERSKSKGFHIWYFLEKPIPTYKFRLVLEMILEEEEIKAEIFPKQDNLNGLGYGNFVNLPLFKKTRDRDRTVFVDDDNQIYPDQWKLLASINQISEERLDEIIEINELSRKTPKPPSARDNGNYKGDLLPCAKTIFENGVDEGCRDECAFRLAIHFKKKGLPQEAVIPILEAWNEKNRPPLENTIIHQKVESAYKGYAGYGCENPLINQFCDPNCPIKRAELSKSEAPREALAYHLTDLGNAERLVAMHGKDVRYNISLGWLAWDGIRWTRDRNGIIERKAKQTIRAIYKEASQIEDDEQRKKLGKFALTCESNRKIKDMISLAQSEPEIPISTEELDIDPFLLNVNNATLNLKTGAILPHRKDDFITKLSPVDFDLKAECPHWNAFLKEIMQGNQELITYLQRLLGYCLTGDTSEQILPIFYGRGANGKSTLLETIKYILGDYAYQIDPSSLMLKRFETIRNDLARLQGIRFCPSIEVDKGRHLAESLAKQITGGEAVVARFLYHEYFEFHPQFKIILACNHKPTIKGTDHAIWRRIKLVPFTYKIPEEKQDKKYREKHLIPEASGILNWLIQGCLKWQSKGLDTPEEITEATNLYKGEMDILSSFIDEECVIDPLKTVAVKDMYGRYMEWSIINKENPVGKREFNERLREKGYFTKRGTANTLEWIGITLSQNSIN